MTDPGSNPTPAGPLPDPDGHDELSPTARQLRDALAAREAAAQPHDRLEEIRMTARVTRRRNRAWAAVAGAAAVVVIGGGAYATTRTGDDDVRTVASAPSSTADDSPSASPSTSGPGATASGTARGTQSASASSATSAPAGTASAGALPSGATTVPVYWLGGQPPKLFREYVKAGSAENDATNALRAMLAGSPSDPDYTSPWSADPTAEVSQEGNRLVVDLSAAAASGGSGDGEIAVQQLVHTVTAAAGDDLPVQIRVDGSSSPTLFGTKVAETVSRSPQAQVQAPAWITSVTPTAGSVTVKGTGTGFEGTLMYTITDANGTEVARDAVQAGANGDYAEFTFTAALPSGTYTVAVYAPDESNGEGPGSVGDTKQFTVS